MNRNPGHDREFAKAPRRPVGSASRKRVEHGRTEGGKAVWVYSRAVERESGRGVGLSSRPLGIIPLTHRWFDSRSILRGDIFSSQFSQMIPREGGEEREQRSRLLAGAYASSFASTNGDLEAGGISLGLMCLDRTIVATI